MKIKNEELNNAVSWVLGEIEKEFIITSKDEDVYFELSNSNNNGNISISDQRRAVKFLEKDGVLKITKEKMPLGISSIMQADIMNLKPVGYYLKIIESKFNDIYGEIKIPLQIKARYSENSVESIKKILAVLGYLRNEWDLTPRDSSQLQNRYIKANETYISEKKFHYWIREYGLNDFYELENILTILGQEGLILKAEFINEAM